MYYNWLFIQFVANFYSTHPNDRVFEAITQIILRLVTIFLHCNKAQTISIRAEIDCVKILQGFRMIIYYGMAAARTTRSLSAFQPSKEFLSPGTADSKVRSLAKV